MRNIQKPQSSNSQYFINLSDYYDYQHLVRDYKEFTSMTPANFYMQDTQSPERKFGIIEV